MTSKHLIHVPTLDLLYVMESIILHVLTVVGRTKRSCSTVPC